VVAYALDRGFRLLARRAGTVAIGEDLARGYSGGRAPVLSTGFSLIREQEIVDLDEALAKPWDGGELRLLSVGRLDPEKNPLLLIEALGRLRSVDPRWRLTIAGDGVLRSALEAEVRRLELGDAVELLGDVSNGPELWRLYRQTHLFLHVSFTEGLPQVLYEAHAAGIPVVATAVGGVPSALAHGETGLLIPPGDVDAAVAAVTRVAADEPYRRRLISRGLSSAHRETLEAQLDRTVSFFRMQLQAEPCLERSIVGEQGGVDGLPGRARGSC
jgi:glycosyltransferase involved in cell wall biosynthesis